MNLREKLAAMLRDTGAFPYEEWSDDADGDYSIDGLAALIVTFLEDEGVVAKGLDAEEGQ